ncbi:MAG: hypothetical protein J1E02_07720 [Coprobacter sp.]|nr:hypothetical protein [Coprobacter sp.]
MKMMKKMIVMLLGILLFTAGAGARNETVAADTAAVNPAMAEVNPEVTLLQLQQEHAAAMEHMRQDHIEDTLIPVVAIVCGTAVPALVIFLIVFTGLKHRTKVKLARYDLMAKALESGKELPDYFFEEGDNRPASGKSRLSRGFTLVGAGVGLLFFGLVLSSKYVWAFSAVPLLIGAGQLLVYRIEARSAESLSEPESEK